jgi:MoaA/NifB/PqqE/SkfB family radical SAM enzyme
MIEGRPNPEHLLDLIYSDSRIARVEEMRPFFRATCPALPNRLHRVTVFLTFACNLRCIYCNTTRSTKGKPWPAKGKEYDLARFRRVIDQVIPHNVQHLHLTGGEATLVRDLPSMVEYLSHSGIPCSLTTNGTADPAMYRELVENGLKEIRISFDTHIPEDFDRIVGRKGTYRKVLNAVNELVRLRDREGKGIYIILNVCVGEQNRERIAESIQHCIALKPNDVKLIGISHERAGLAQFKDRHRIVEEVRDYLSSFPKNRFSLLRLKLKTIFARDTYGFEDLTSQRIMQHCFIPLTERIVDPDYYYPCPVYVREGGEPLGRLDEDDFKTQQEKIFAFAKGRTCVDDPICSKYCINCCKKFNLHANAEVNKKVKGPSGLWEPIAHFTHYEGEITNEEILSTMRRVMQERKTFSPDVEYRPFIVIKPSGMSHVEKIMSHLNSWGITVQRRVRIQDWNQVALRLYSVPLTEERIFRGLLLAKALPQVESTTKSELWVLRENISFAELEELKKSVRAKLPPSQCLIFCPDEILVTNLGYLHSPSENSYLIEANLLLK